jgi:hypothetical protein
MLCECRVDRLSIRCLMADEVKRSFCNAWYFCSLFGQFISLVVSNDVCVSSDVADGLY